MAVLAENAFTLRPAGSGDGAPASLGMPTTLPIDGRSTSRLVGASPSSDHPEGAVDGAKRRARPAALEHSELLPEHEDLDDEARPRAKGGEERAEYGRDDREHDGRR